MPAPRDATAPAAKPPAPLSWGVVGRVHRVEPLATLPGQVGVVRLLPNTVRYARPPLTVAWAEVRAEPGRFEMAWPGDAAAARSLARLGDDLRTLRFADGEVPAGHPWCRDLDAAVFSLLDAAGELAKQGWGVGLLTPAGVLLDRTADGVVAVPVDLGFTWAGEFGDPPWDHSPGRPDWLDPDPAANPTARAWDRPPVEQQFAAPTGGPFPPAAPGSTVRTLAAVIGWALLGEPDGAHADPAALTAPVWAVLRAALDGEYPTPRAFADALRAAPPSTHFTEPVVPLATTSGAPRRGDNWVAVAVGAGLLAVAVALLILFNRSPRTAATTALSTPGTETTTPTDADPRGALDDYNKTPAADLPGRVAKFGPVAAADRAANDPAFSQKVSEARVKLFADWVTACEAEVGAGADAAKRGEAGHNLRTLTDSYAALFKDHPPTDPDRRDKEQRWLDQYDRLADSLGWPR